MVYGLNRVNMDFLVVGLPDNIRRLEEQGHFDEAIDLIKRILSKRTKPHILISRLEWELERIWRIKKDYSLDEDDVFRLLKEKIANMTKEDFDRWLDQGFLEFIWVEGKRKFFNNFLANFLRENSEIRMRLIESDRTLEQRRNLLRNHVDEVTEKNVTHGAQFICPIRNRVLMKLRLRSGAVPGDEKIRVWLPFPREDPLQPEIQLISVSTKDYFLAPPNWLQRTIYLEGRSNDEKDIEFEVQYEYVARAAYLPIDSKSIQLYVKDETYEKFTAEQLPHIAFTPYLRKLQEEIVSEETNPYLKAWRIYDWITENMRYALVPEYSTIECISEYAARNLRGDCGVQALLFITLCRIAGVPARWQSGWYLNPIRPSPHDWAQFYVEPHGWLYVDPSFGGHWRSTEKYHKFYFGNIDHFRLIANADISSDFIPRKIHHRSDTVDNQRGEVEWSGGNLYYDQWSYEMRVISHEPLPFF